MLIITEEFLLIDYASVYVKAYFNLSSKLIELTKISNVNRFKELFRKKHLQVRIFFFFNLPPFFLT